MIARMPGRGAAARVDTRDDAVEALEAVKLSEFCAASVAVLVVIVIAISCSIVWLLLGDHP